VAGNPAPGVGHLGPSSELRPKPLPLLRSCPRIIVFRPFVDQFPSWSRRLDPGRPLAVKQGCISVQRNIAGAASDRRLRPADHRERRVELPFIATGCCTAATQQRTGSVARRSAIVSGRSRGQVIAAVERAPVLVRGQSGRVQQMLSSARGYAPTKDGGDRGLIGYPSRRICSSEISPADAYGILASGSPKYE
jgi:hypothetical protein